MGNVLFRRKEEELVLASSGRGNCSWNVFIYYETSSRKDRKYRSTP